MATTIESSVDGIEESVPLIGLITREHAPLHHADEERFPLLAPFVRLLDRHLDAKPADKLLQTITLPAENCRREYRSMDYGLIRYDETSVEGLSTVVRSLSNPPKHPLVHQPRNHIINIIEPQNPEDFDIEPGLYVEKYFTTVGSQQLRAEHVHPLGQTYFEVVEPVGRVALKYEALTEM